MESVAQEKCMNRINHILVVVDPTAGGSQSVVDKAGLLVQRLGATVELLICDIESALDDDVVTLRAHQTPDSDTRLLDLLDALAAPMRARETSVTVRVILDLRGVILVPSYRRRTNVNSASGDEECLRSDVMLG